MVRYSEIIREEFSQQNIHDLLKEHFRLDESNKWIEGKNYEIVAGKVNILSGYAKNTNMIQKKSLGYIPIPFGNIDCSFLCLQCKLTSLKNCPETIKNTFHCTGNRLTSLEYLPTEMTSLQCYGNKFTSLNGIDEKSKISYIWISYLPRLPLLRLLCAKEHINFRDKMGVEQKEYKNIEDIFNKYIQDKNMLLYEKQMRCQHELLEYPEYKANAEW